MKASSCEGIDSTDVPHDGAATDGNERDKEGENEAERKSNPVAGADPGASGGVTLSNGVLQAPESGSPHRRISGFRRWSTDTDEMNSNRPNHGSKGANSGGGKSPCQRKKWLGSQARSCSMSHVQSNFSLVPKFRQRSSCTSSTEGKPSRHRQMLHRASEIIDRPRSREAEGARQQQFRRANSNRSTRRRRSSDTDASVSDHSDLLSELSSSEAMDTDINVSGDVGENKKRLAPGSLRYLPKVLRESYAIRIRRPSVLGTATLAALDLRLRLRRPRTLPEYRDLTGSILILDLSGFTALGERLRSELGDSEGAAEFAARVNTILSTMVERVYEFGGDVLMFAGDALICLFEERFDVETENEGTDSDSEGDGDSDDDSIFGNGRDNDDGGAQREAEARSRVRGCCLHVLGQVAAGDGPFRSGEFTIHGGAAHGLIRSFFLGQPSTAPGDCAFVVSGWPLRHAGTLLNKAGKGEVWLDGMGGGPITEEEGKRVFLEFKKSGQKAPKSPLSATEDQATGSTLSAVRAWEKEEAASLSSGKISSTSFLGRYDVHPYARAYLGTLAARRADRAENAMSILLNELRPVAIVFVGLHDLDDIDARDATLLRLMNDAFVSLSRITHSCNGAVRDMLFDDKGCVFISVFGAHSHEVNPCFDATVCAMRMQGALKDLDLQRFSLGVSFGDCFCGEVGPAIRADYVVMGPEVNMAARLMGKAPNRGTLVSKRIYSYSKDFIKFVKSEKIQVKGKDGLFHAYIPQGRIERGSVVNEVAAAQQPFIPMPSREIGMKAMLEGVEAALNDKPKIAFVCGGPFLGKSRMIRDLSDKAVEANFTVLQSFRTSLDSFTSYFPFRQIASTALRKCASLLFLGDEEEDGKAEETDDSLDEVSAVMNLIERKVLNKTDRVVIGSIVPTVTDAQLLSLLKGQNPRAMTKSLVDSLMKVLVPLQPLMMIFEGDGDIDPSSWSLMAELMRRATSECPQLMLVISSRNSPAVPSAATILRKEAVQVKLTPFEKFETEIYLQVLLGIRDKGIRVDERLLCAVHDRANGCPLFIEYIVTWALDKSIIEYVDGTNKLSFKTLDDHSEDATNVIPRELSNIVLAAFNNLSPILWDALKIASCIGYSFDADVYDALTVDLDFMPKIKELASSYDAFERSDANRYKWKHQAVYEAVKSLLIKNQRIQIHSMIVEVFERSKMGVGPNSQVAQGDVHRLLARHCSLAEKWEGAFNQYMEAGKRAEETYNFPEAAKMYEESISSQGKMDPKPPVGMRLLPTVKLGSCLREMARYKEAELVLTQCLKDAESEMAENVGDEQMYVLALTALAVLNQAQSKYVEARELYEKALPIARNIQESRSSLWLAGNIAGYAETLRKSGDLPLAEKLHREALDIRNRAAEEHACTDLELAVSYTQLGCTLFGMKHYEEAYKEHRMALLSRFKFLDFSHGLISESLNYCAESLCALGRGGDGIPLAMHAVEIRKHVFGTSHPAFAHALSVLASCYHAVGRSCDARTFLEQCLEICEVAFSKNHANIIPNLMNYGKVLRSTGNFREARDVYERAIEIHQLNFKEGQKVSELEKCRSEVFELTNLISNEMSIQFELDANGNGSDTRLRKQKSQKDVMNIPTVDVESGGTPIIVLTDIGKDVDDELALVLLAALKRMYLLNPIAVVTTLSPEIDRSQLARGSLDALGLSNVPVGVGSSGGVEDGSKLEFYGGQYARSCSCIIESGVDLMIRALESVPSKSVQLLCIASLSDAATLLRENQDLFVSKVKEVVIMGGVKSLETDFLEPDTAYNNNCDMDSARYVYEKCQVLGVRTITLTRWAAYGCPVSNMLLDDLAKTEHMVASNIRNVSESAISQLWTKVNLPPSDPRREKLPSRCDRQWFCRTFMGKDDVVRDGYASIWSHVTKLNMYDPLALLSCVPAFRETHFHFQTKYVNGTVHKVAGVSAIDTGVADSDALCEEYSSLFGLAFRSALQNIC